MPQRLSNAQMDFLSGIDDGKPKKKGYAKRTGGAPGVKQTGMARRSGPPPKGKKEASAIRRSLTPKPTSKMKKAELERYIMSHRGKGKQAAAPSGLS